MSLAEEDLTDGSVTQETSQENKQKESETLRAKHPTGQFGPKDEDVRSKDLKVNQKQRRTISPLTLFKEDLNNFKEDLLSVFKDKDTKPTQDENKSSASALDLLKEDLSQFKVDVTSVFNRNKATKPTDPKPSQLINPLAFLKEDLSQFRDDISSALRSGLSFTAKDDSSDAVETPDWKAERSEPSDEPFKGLFRKDQRKGLKTSQKTAKIHVENRMVLEKSEKQLDFEPFSAQKNITEMNNNRRDGVIELDVKETKEETGTKQSEAKSIDETKLWTKDTSGVSSQVFEEDKDKKREEDKCSLSTGLVLFCPRDTNREDMDQPGGNQWLLKNFACYLTFDPNTANSELRLTDCNRKVTRVWSEHRCPDHPERFRRCPQLLCREGLLDSAYWEVVWSGGTDVGVAYNSICRDGAATSCLLGHNEHSWSLECSEGTYTPSHGNRRLKSCSPRPFTHRVGVYLDWANGSLSFYCVSREAMVHLHTFRAIFTEPLYPGFWVWAYNGSVSLCQVELDWERLLQ